MSESAFSAFIFFSLFGSFLSFLIIFTLMFVENKTLFHEERFAKIQLENAKKGAEIRVLQAQINPHFLYNTLGSLVALVKLEKTSSALSMLYALSKLLRYSYRMKALVSLQEEIDYVRNYLLVQQFRFAERLVTEIWLAPEMMQAQIPSHTLQPIVENAIVHAVERLETPTTVQIYGHYSHDGMIQIEVMDNGPGVPARVVEAFEANKRLEDVCEREHIGLYNVHRKLELHFGQGSGVHIDSQYAGGSRIVCTLPQKGGEPDAHSHRG